MLYLPSKSVATPRVVDLICTLTPGRGVPFSSVTVPEICLFCAHSREVVLHRAISNKKIFRFILPKLFIGYLMVQIY